MLSYDSTRKANAKPSMHPNTLAKPPTSIIPMASDKAPKAVVDRIQLVGKWVSALEAGVDFLFNLRNSYVFYPLVWSLL